MAYFNGPRLYYWTIMKLSVMVAVHYQLCRLLDAIPFGVLTCVIGHFA